MRSKVCYDDHDDNYAFNGHDDNDGGGYDDDIDRYHSQMRSDPFLNPFSVGFSCA